MNISPPDFYLEGTRLAAAGRQHDAIASFEKALAQQPDDIRVLFALASLAREMNLAKPAEAFYRKVLALAPNRLEALIGLANLLRSQARYGEAGTLLTQALEAGEEPELWLTLGVIERETGDDAAAENCFRRAMHLRSDYAKALGNLADILSDKGEYAEALHLYDRVLAAEPGNAQAQLNRGIIHLLTGNFERGWRDYAARLKLKGKVPVPDHGLPKWDGRFHSGMRLLVTAEQGIGDQIMFASMLPDLAARAKENHATIIADCEPRLVALFARSFPDIDIRSCKIDTDGEVKTHYGWLKQAGGADAAVTLGTLPSIIRTRIEDFPQEPALRVDAAEVQRWRQAFADLPRPHVALCWRSGKSGGSRSMHYAPLEHWAGLIRALPGTAVSAQYDLAESEIATLESISGRKIAVPAGLNQKNEIDRTAAMLSACDALVTAPTAVSWLAAAAGVPTCKIVRDPAWTGFGQGFEPFAPAARFAVCETPGDWPSAFSAVIERLKA